MTGAVRYLTLILSFFSLCLFADSSVVDSATGEVFPSTVSFDFGGNHYDLQATGVATRKKFFVNIYSVAHYLQTGAISNADKIEQILQDNLAKQLTMKWVRAVNADKVQEGFQESFKNSLLPTDFRRLQNEISQFLQFFSRDVKKGDEHVLRWIPGGHIQVLINGKTAGEITNKDFAVGLWDIWFGSKGAVDRNQLISLLK